jgi:cysteinyl-tRNA synthetase
MTGENLNKTREVLRDLKALVDGISEAAGNPPAEPRDSPVVRSLEEGFRERMDDDLDVKSAVDRIAGSLGDLTARKARGGLSPAEAGAALAALRRVDGILQVIFPPGTTPDP